MFFILGFIVGAAITHFVWEWRRGSRIWMADFKFWLSLYNPWG